MLAHPSKRKHGMPGEDAYFVHDGGSIVVIGVADGTSVAGACARVCVACRRCSLNSVGFGVLCRFIGAHSLTQPARC